MSNTNENLDFYNTYNGNDTITFGDGRSVPIAHTGTSILPTPARKLILSRLLHIPSLSYNLLSIFNLVKDNPISITFDANGFVFKDQTTNQIILQGPCSKGVYKIAAQPSRLLAQALTVTNTPSVDWHLCLGHPHHRILKQISHSNPSLHISHFKSACTSCMSYKGQKLSFDRSTSRTRYPLELVHSDVWGPSPVSSHQGFRYYIIFVDDFSRFIWLFPIMHKSDVTNTFIQFVTFIERQTNRKIKIIRSDGGGEFVNNHFQTFTKNAGIMHQTSCPYTPEQNGIAERKHRHIITMTRTLLQIAELPMNYWLDAASTATYLINRLPSITTENMSPLQRMFNIQPSYEHLRIFGCECYPLLPPVDRTKLTPTSPSCIFLGYSDTSKGYKCLNSITKQISISRNVKFNESVFPSKDRSSQDHQTDSHIPSPLLIPPSTLYSQKSLNQRQVLRSKSQDTSLPANIPSYPPTPTAPNSNLNLPHLSNNTPKHLMTTRTKTGSLKPVNRLNLLHQDQPQGDPTTYSEASKKFEWRQAMAQEFFAMQKKGTWILV
ncbi:hypothetical protein KFK09_026565 [Dendrobium nobile]|uniref:Integrase catalytic domain-containing protein n=1 Tax=Dendrobium nobile TaxID=94219 RepID=A0A8T3AD88_DENNO|nr:hypothetical protein KFK09_026565 [Dendrobium nobile]